MKTSPPLIPRERALALACVGLLLIASFVPAVPQSATYHHFADQRGWLGVPFALDVLSNLPFALWGVWGLMGVQRWCERHRAVPTVQRLVVPAAHAATVAAMAQLFFAGLLVTAAASAFYHLHPDDLGLAVDRCGMVVAFAGLLGLVTALQVTGRAGVVLAAAVLVAGPVAVAVWRVTGNALPWACVQIGGMAWVMALACLVPPHAGAPVLRIHWWAVIACYGLAKVFELADHSLFALTAQSVSGHTLKHLAAGCAAWPVCAALWLHRHRPAAQSLGTRRGVKAPRPLQRSRPV